MNSTDPYDIKFNFVRFLTFLHDNNIISVAIASILSDRINEITNSFIDHLIMPIINRDADQDGEKDISVIENINVKLLGMNFKPGKFFLAIIKFTIVTYFIFLLSSILKKYANKL